MISQLVGVVAVYNILFLIVVYQFFRSQYEIEVLRYKIEQYAMAKVAESNPLPVLSNVCPCYVWPLVRIEYN